ncbi:N-acetyltransferase 10 [Nowakowskiella sp. JEL0407]|nr:N-acetyltransferase 10 [Nowakowskiella sp. JEL0407]
MEKTKLLPSTFFFRKRESLPVPPYSGVIRKIWVLAEANSLKFSNKKKRMNQMKKQIARGTKQVDQDDPFELFVSSTNIRYTYYKESHKILGNTYGMCVLQDFEAVTPNLLARTIETVEGGGIVVLLLRTMSSLKQVYSMTMDVHSRYRTETTDDPVARFNERFILSLGDCETCLVVDDELNVLPISKGKDVKLLTAKKDKELTPEQEELKKLKTSLEDTQPVGSLVGCAKTLDQAKAILTFVDGIADKSLRSTVTLTAARGRGKSAALGISIAAAVAYGYSNIFITSPSPENLKTLFEFIFKGFDALGYEEHMDYDIVQSTNPEFQKAVVRVNIFKEHRQTIQYIQPADHHVLAQAELLVIDEAAAIPLPIVRNLMGPYLVFMASTINGYEGTGRSLSLKLIQQLREQSRGFSSKSDSSDGVSVGRDGKESKPNADATNVGGRTLREIKLEEPIRYGSGDPVESWLNKILCLDCCTPTTSTLRGTGTTGCPDPAKCELYYVNRDTLFSFHPVSEAFLQKMMSLYVSSHYKNSPNDLQLMSDAPAHHLFVLLPPISQSGSSTVLPEPLCVVQLAMEGSIAKGTALASLAKGVRHDGDLIPWVVSQQFQDDDFASLSGARVVRIATHPDYIGMGYGGRTLELLERYFKGEIQDLSEDQMEEEYEFKRYTDEELQDATLETDDIKVRDPSTMPPLLLKLSERKLKESLQWLGVSYGITPQLQKFWKRGGYVPVYVRQTANELTGEHTCIMLKSINSTVGDASSGVVKVGKEQWLNEFVWDFRMRFLELLGYSTFQKFSPMLVMSILEAAGGVSGQSLSNVAKSHPLRSGKDIAALFSPHDLKRLDSYSQNLLDFHVIMDLIPKLSTLYFLNRLDPGENAIIPSTGQPAKAVKLSAVQAAIFVGCGLQRKMLEQVATELELPHAQTMALFAKSVKRCSTYFEGVVERVVAKEIDENVKKSGNGERSKGKRAIDDEEAWEAKEENGMDQELSEAGNEVVEELKKRQKKIIEGLDLSKYAVGGTDEEWSKVTLDPSKKTSAMVSISSSKKRLKTLETTAASLAEKFRGEKSGIVDHKNLVGNKKSKAKGAKGL